MTATLKRILVPVDFGDASAAAVQVAGALARGCGGQLTLLHAEALEAPLYFTSEQVVALAAERKQRQTQAQKYLDTFGRRQLAAAGIFVENMTAVIETRPPVEAIERHAADADLIVIGTHGRKGPSLWWLGSVAERVLRDVSTPVLVVHAGQATGPTLRRLAVFAAPGLRGDAALALAGNIGQAFGAAVVDRRGDTVAPAEMFADVSMVVVAEPQVHDRLWRTRVGEPLIRTGAGPVLFVPEEH
jgi:nucleotide-binding universal stress UspA family protein